MSSTVRFDGETFVLPNSAVNRFINLGQQSGNKSLSHTLFLKRVPISNTFFLSERHQLSGYCSYYFLYNNQRVLSGLVFVSHSGKTVVSDFTLTVGDCLHNELPDNFEPIFTLENCGVLIFKACDGSILLIPSEVESSLLVKVE